MISSGLISYCTPYGTSYVIQHYDIIVTVSSNIKAPNSLGGLRTPIILVRTRRVGLHFASSAAGFLYTKKSPFFTASPRRRRSSAPALIAARHRRVHSLIIYFFLPGIWGRGGGGGGFVVGTQRINATHDSDDEKSTTVVTDHLCPTSLVVRRDRGVADRLRRVVNVNRECRRYWQRRCRARLLFLLQPHQQLGGVG